MREKTLRTGERRSPPLFPIFSLSLLVCLGGTVDSLPSQGERLRAALEKDGFTVQAGRLEFFDVASNPDLPTYFGNNASSPYGFFSLPPAPGQTAPNPLAGDDGWSRFWRLRPDEAVVFLGPTPPAARYFGFTSYLYDRKGPLGVVRLPLFASLGDTLNNLTIATSGTPAGAAGNPFDAQTMIITTADRSIDTRVRAAASAAAIPASLINTLPVPSSILRLGLNADADSFAQILRVALFLNEAGKKAYVNAPPGLVLRLTPKGAERAAPLDPLRVPTLRASGTGTNEDSLKSALDQLEAAVLSRHAALMSTRIPTRELVIKGFDCIANGTPCLGDNHDAVYLDTIPILATGRLPDTPRDFFVIFGVNHEAAGKATYSNASIYYRNKALGVAGIDSTRMKGSAELYLPGNPQASLLYAIKVARTCGDDPYCLAVPVTFPGVPLDQELSITFRVYLEPQTGTAPSASEILFDRVIRFSP